MVNNKVNIFIVSIHTDIVIMISSLEIRFWFDVWQEHINLFIIGVIDRCSSLLHVGVIIVEFIHSNRRYYHRNSFIFICGVIEFVVYCHHVDIEVLKRSEKIINDQSDFLIFF